MSVGISEKNRYEMPSFPYDEMAAPVKKNLFDKLFCCFNSNKYVVAEDADDFDRASSTSGSDSSRGSSRSPSPPFTRTSNLTCSEPLNKSVARYGATKPASLPKRTVLVKQPNVVPLANKTPVFVQPNVAVSTVVSSNAQHSEIFDRLARTNQPHAAALHAAVTSKVAAKESVRSADPGIVSAIFEFLKSKSKPETQPQLENVHPVGDGKFHVAFNYISKDDGYLKKKAWVVSGAIVASAKAASTVTKIEVNAFFLAHLKKNFATLNQ